MLAARSAARPARPLPRSTTSSLWRKGSSTFRPRAARSTSCPFGRSSSARSAKTVAKRPLRASAQELVPSADSKHFSSPREGIKGRPSFPRRRRVSHIVARAVTPALGTSFSPPSVKARASWIASRASCSSGSCVKPRRRARYRVALAWPLQRRRKPSTPRRDRKRARAWTAAAATGKGPFAWGGGERPALPASSSSKTSCPEAIATSAASAAAQSSGSLPSAAATSTRASTAPAPNSEVAEPPRTQSARSVPQASRRASRVGASPPAAAARPRATSRR
mmetsp:Transcript_104163/g.232663  ORF Transcript_104163/g.232663 Transcript_104163/m.232663 type:complete len:279 (-) Transcript_104163:456-1292(-)